ncbi:hypothetical protein D3C72_1403190 [compost metagenome]
MTFGILEGRTTGLLTDRLNCFAMVTHGVHIGADFRLVFRITLEQCAGEDQALVGAGMAVAVAHIGIGKHMLLTLTVNRIDFHHALARLTAVCARIHTQRTADGAGNAVIEMEAANAVIHGHGRNMLVRADRTGLDAVFAGKLHLAETFGRQTDDNARDAAIAHQKVGADADHRQRHVFRQNFQEGNQIIGIVRLEHDFRQTAGSEPRHAVHGRIRCQTSPQFVYPVAEPPQQFNPIDLSHSDFPDMLFNSEGSAAAHCVIFPAPKRTTKSPGFAMPATTEARSSRFSRKRASRWPAALMAETSASELAPSMGSSPAA